jgi:cell wall-associated NlpC family hydrolase
MTTLIIPQPGDFDCVPMGGDAGKAIRVAEWLDGSGFGNYEHAEIKVNATQTMAAYPGGAALQTIPAEQWQGGWLWSTGIIALTAEQRAKIVSTAMSLEGTPYSAADYFALVAHRLHVPGSQFLKGYVASSKHMICSQLVDYCYMMAGVHLFNDGRWPGYVTPADLANVLLHPETVRYA